jgi:hypothetical protein
MRQTLTRMTTTDINRDLRDLLEDLAGDDDPAILAFLTETAAAWLAKSSAVNGSTTRFQSVPKGSGPSSNPDAL